MVLTFLSTYPKCWLLYPFRFYLFLKLFLKYASQKLLFFFLTAENFLCSHNSGLEGFLCSIMFITCIREIIWNVKCECGPPCLRCLSCSSVYVLFPLLEKFFPTFKIHRLFSPLSCIQPNQKSIFHLGKWFSCSTFEQCIFYLWILSLAMWKWS